MAVSEAKKKTNAAWDKDNTRRYYLKVMKSTESDIIERLDEQDNVNGYIKQLIRDDITRSAYDIDMANVHTTINVALSHASGIMENADIGIYPSKEEVDQLIGIIIFMRLANMIHQKLYDMMYEQLTNVKTIG